MPTKKEKPLTCAQQADKVAHWIRDWDEDRQGGSMDLKFGGDGDMGENLITALTAYFKSERRKAHR